MSVIGTAMGMAVAGELFGPPLGAIAKVAGTEIVFGSVLVGRRRADQRRGEDARLCLAGARRRGAGPGRARHPSDPDRVSGWSRFPR